MAQVYRTFSTLQHIETISQEIQDPIMMKYFFVMSNTKRNIHKKKKF